MKFFVIFASVILSISAQAPMPPVDDLFSESWAMQQRLSPQQQSVDTVVSELRLSLTSVLDVKTAQALQEIENNTRQIVELERPYRVMLTALPVSECSTNLLSQLSFTTQFSGFNSANCITTYDNESQQVVDEAQDFIAQYEGVFVRLQKAVIHAYRSPRAVFTNQAAIVTHFTNEYSTRMQEWEAIRPQAEDFDVNVANQLEQTHTTLDGCMSVVRSGIEATYQQIISFIPVCEEFDN